MTACGSGDHPPAVGSAVAVQTAERDDDAAARQVLRSPREPICGVHPCGVHLLGKTDAACGDIPRHQLVRHALRALDLGHCVQGPVLVSTPGVPANPTTGPVPPMGNDRASALCAAPKWYTGQETGPGARATGPAAKRTPTRCHLPLPVS